jgi:hypothetical protein
MILFPHERITRPDEVREHVRAHEPDRGPIPAAGDRAAVESPAPDRDDEPASARGLTVPPTPGRAEGGATRTGPPRATS